MNSAIHHLSTAQRHADAVRAATRYPRVPEIETQRPVRRRLHVVWRLRPALA